MMSLPNLVLCSSYQRCVNVTNEPEKIVSHCGLVNILSIRCRHRRIARSAMKLKTSPSLALRTTWAERGGEKTEAASKSDTHSLSGGLFAELKLYQQLIKSEWISMRLRKHLRHRIPFFLCARFHLFLLDLKHDDEKWTFTFYMHTRILWQIVAGFVWLKVQAMLLLALTRFDTLFIESRSINSFLTTSFWQT